MWWTRLEMLLLALRDPVSLCNMPFATLMPFKTDFAQQIGQNLKVEKCASVNGRLWVSAPFCVGADRGESNERGNQ